MDFFANFGEYPFIIGLILVSIVFYLNITRGFQLMTLSDYKSNFVQCENKHCVRCNKYGNILSTAYDILNSLGDCDITRNIRNGFECKYLGIEAQQPNVFNYKLLQSVPVWTTVQLKDVSLLQDSFDSIYCEYERLVKCRDQGHWIQNNTPSGSWDVFPLVNQGEIIQDNVAICPLTFSVVRSLPSVLINNVFGNVMFSFVKEGTMIAEHYGPTNIRLRCHLGKHYTVVL